MARGKEMLSTKQLLRKDKRFAQALRRAGLTQSSVVDPERNIPVPIDVRLVKFLSVPGKHKHLFSSVIKTQYVDGTQVVERICSRCGKVSDV